MIDKNKGREVNKRLGLALSGGGYRAAAFHLGTLRKLHEMNLLEKVDVISTISGGSIAGVYYALHKDNFDGFAGEFKKALRRSVLRRICCSPRFILTALGLILFLVAGSWALCWLDIASGWIVGFVFLCLLAIIVLQFRFINLTKMKIAAYQKIFFGDKQLKDLPDVPMMAINATNLETGTLWTYSKNKMGDSSYSFPKDGSKSIAFKGGDFPLAVAVASSTAVPVPFNPVKVSKRFFANPDDFERIDPSLIDGGLYDNQGIHKITQPNSSYHCDIIICSDASQPYEYKFTGKNSVGVLYRATDVMMRKIKSLQFIRDVYDSDREIAYFSLDWQYERSVLEFVKSEVNNKFGSALLSNHGVNLREHKTDSGFDFQKIAAVVKQKIGFNGIVSSGLSQNEIEVLSRIKTNLTALSDQQITLLSRHAAVLTELHVKLYCPSLM